MNATKTVVCRDIKGAIHKVPVDMLTFRPSVYAVIVEGEKVLLHGYADGWDFPGGAINLGESIEDALMRELKEETGLTARRAKLLNIYSDFFVHPADNKPYHTFLMHFSCTDVSGKISTDFFDEHEKKVARPAEWIPIERIGTLKFFNPLTSEECERLAHMAAANKGV